MTKVDENIKIAKYLLSSMIERCKTLEEENKKLKEELEKWKDTVKTLNEYNKFRIAENKKLREELSAYDREYRDEDKKAENIFMEEDTLQELKDLGKI